MMEHHKILIVDDVVANLNMMVGIIKDKIPHFKVLRAIDGKSALKIAEFEKPSLIISDWEMPEMSGIELIQKLKSKKETYNIPVIMCSGVMTSTEDLETALKAGAIDYIRKPLDPVELIARTQSVMKISEYQNQIIEQKNRELAENSMYLVQNNKFLSKLIKNLEDLSESPEDKIITPKTIRNIIDEINSQIKEDAWKRFEIYFQRVHVGFQKNLITKFPKLTTAELRLSTFLRMGMNTKDIASALFQSSDSVKVSRYRLRKKFNLDKDDSLSTFLSQF